MSQTRGALTFLLSAYRAIFKNSFYKGLAQAAMICAGMMAAQEAVGDTKILTQSNIEEGEYYQITGTTDIPEDYTYFYTYLQISGNVEYKPTRIEIDGGNASSDGNFITNSDIELNILSIYTSDGSDGLLIGSGAAVQVGSLNVDRGTLLVSGSADASAKIYGYATTVAQDGAGMIQIGSYASVESGENGITVYGNGAIEFLSNAVNASLSAGDLIISSSTLKVDEGASGTVSASFSYLSDGGTLSVASGGTLDFNIASRFTADTGSAIDLEGTLNLIASEPVATFFLYGGAPERKLGCRGACGSPFFVGHGRQGHDLDDGHGR